MDFPQRVNGWALYAHPCFQETYDALVAEVETLKGKDPENYQRKAATKLLAVVHKVIEEHITVNPSSPAFRHGKSLGSGKNKDWSRVKFGAGRYRLFFRYSEKEKVIILGWMNDENTLRTYGKKTDAYTVFSKMLKKRTSSCRLGNPHPRDRRTPLMVFTMPAERIRVDQRAPFLTPRPESLQPQPFAALPGYPQECLHQQ
ncbi:toxin of the SohB(PrlF)-YhaV toxin-antitoxin system [Escherichia coli]|uniref:Toxin of the SohB(PrlF)-YhaV toxin-antitoxin system n=15 Tax=Enterobacterales TaxID=91347 RepID=A0A376JRQ2_ECOLX|nr:toxin of the SohB(PrlF)-YhaV toxin-antitoxin system [Escherichia coli]